MLCSPPQMRRGGAPSAGVVLNKGLRGGYPPWGDSPAAL